MEKKPVYSISFDPRTGKINGEDKGDGCVTKRKPVFCAHPNIMASVTPYFNKCLVCAKEWDCCKEPPRVMIGFIESGEEGGK